MENKEQPIIVLIDPDLQKIFLYGEYNREFRLDELFIVKAFLKDKTVMYVTQAEETSCDELLETASAIKEQIEMIPEKRFYCIDMPGYTNIPELKTKFAGPKDFKSVENLGENVFEKSSTMLKFLLSGKLEVISEEEVNKRKKKPKVDKEQQSSILVPVGVKAEDFVGQMQTEQEIFAEENEVKENEEIETDITDAIKIADIK